MDTVPFVLGSLIILEMIVSVYPQSRVSQDVIETFPYFFRSTGGNRYHFISASFGEQPLTDLEVGLSTQVRRLEADGVLGLDFLRRFTDINLNIPTMQLTLTEA